MRTWDSYLAGEEVVTNAWSAEVTQQSALDMPLLEGLLHGPDDDRGDLEIAVPLARVVHDEFDAYGTSGSPLSNEDSRLLIRALKAVLARLGIDSLDWESIRSIRRFAISRRFASTGEPTMATEVGRLGGTWSTGSSMRSMRCSTLVKRMPCQERWPIRFLRGRRQGGGG